MLVYRESVLLYNIVRGISHLQDELPVVKVHN